MKKDFLSRREFIAKAGTGALVVVVLGPMMGARLLAGGRSGPKTMEPITIDLTDPHHAALTKVGGAIKIPNPLDKKKPIIVTRLSETAYAAFSSKCTHLGCEVSLPENNVITCPCHKAKFDMGGKVTHGPAKKDLKVFKALLEGTTLTIKEQTA